MAISRARALRNSMTDAERKIWYMIRDRRLGNYKFKRQVPAGPYYLDFACFEVKLAIEADGGQHADSVYDERRTAWLEKHGWTMMRFWNNDILTNPEGVARTILDYLTMQKPLTRPTGTVGHPLPRGEGFQ